MTRQIVVVIIILISLSTATVVAQGSLEQGWWVNGGDNTAALGADNPTRTDADHFGGVEFLVVSLIEPAGAPRAPGALNWGFIDPRGGPRAQGQDGDPAIERGI